MKGYIINKKINQLHVFANLSQLFVTNTQSMTITNFYYTYPHLVIAHLVIFWDF